MVNIQNAQPQILIVDDDADIRNLLADYLGEQGWHIHTAEDGQAMQTVLDQNSIDLLLLDLTLPGVDGLILCRNLRASSAVPVIMLTARSTPLDRILGLEMGADDYLCKPFEPRELLVRIRNVLRRNKNTNEEDQAQRLHFSGWTLDLSSHQLQRADGVWVVLSSNEFRLLNALLEQPNRVLSRDRLLNLTQGRDADQFDRSIDLAISRLRHKLGDDARAPQLLKPLRNEGYLLVTQVERK